MNELAIKTHKVDWLKVIDMALNRQNWGKVFNLFVANKVVVKCCLREFNFEDNKAWFRVWADYTYNGRTYSRSSWDNYMTVAYAMDNFTLKTFNQYILKRTIRLLRDIIDKETKNDAKEKYKDQLHRHWKFDYVAEVKKRKLDKEYNAILAIDDEELQEHIMLAFKEKLLEDANKGYDLSVENYCEENTAHIQGFGVILDALAEMVEEDEMQ